MLMIHGMLWTQRTISDGGRVVFSGMHKLLYYIYCCFDWFFYLEQCLEIFFTSCFCFLRMGCFFEGHLELRRTVISPLSYLASFLAVTC